MRSIKRVILYETTDKKRFSDFSVAQAWQSALDFNEVQFEYKTRSDRDFMLHILKIIINNKNELNILLDYLHYYHEFENIYNNYDKLSYPVTVKYDLENKTIKIL